MTSLWNCLENEINAGVQLLSADNYSFWSRSAPPGRSTKSFIVNKLGIILHELIGSCDINPELRFFATCLRICGHWSWGEMLHNGPLWLNIISLDRHHGKLLLMLLDKCLNKVYSIRQEGWVSKHHIKMKWCFPAAWLSYLLCQIFCSIHWYKHFETAPSFLLHKVGY